ATTQDIKCPLQMVRQCMLVEVGVEPVVVHRVRRSGIALWVHMYRYRDGSDLYRCQVYLEGGIDPLQYLVDRGLLVVQLGKDGANHGIVLVPPQPIRLPDAELERLNDAFDKAWSLALSVL